MIKAHVDHSNTFGPIRDQGRRPTCMAIAASDAHGRHVPPGKHMSAEYAFYYAAQYQKPRVHFSGIHPPAMYRAIELDGQPEEMMYPYQEHLSRYASLSIPQVAHNASIYRKTATVLAIDDLKTCLSAGCTPVLHLHVTDGFRSINQNGGILEYAANDPIIANHAVIAVGLGRSPKGEEYVKVRNSWGTGWGIKGYGWLSEVYVKQRFNGGAYYRD